MTIGLRAAALWCLYVLVCGEEKRKGNIKNLINFTLFVNTNGRGDEDKRQKSVEVLI